MNRRPLKSSAFWPSRSPAEPKSPNQEPIFASYSLPLKKAEVQRSRARAALTKRKENKEKRRLKAKKLPFYSKERVYERDLKIMAVDESVLNSCQVPQQIPLSRQGGQGGGRRAAGAGDPKATGSEGDRQGRKQEAI